MDFDTLKEQYIKVNCNTSSYTKDYGLDAYEHLQSVPKETRYEWMMEAIYQKIDSLRSSIDISDTVIELVVLLDTVKGSVRYEIAQTVVDTIFDKENFYFVDRPRVKQALLNVIDKNLKTILDDIL